MEANKKEEEGGDGGGCAAAAAPPPSPPRGLSARGGAEGVAATGDDDDGGDVAAGSSTSHYGFIRVDEDARHLRLDIPDLGQLHEDEHVQAAWLQDHQSDLEFLVKLIKDTRPRMTYIHGPTRTGKTQLLAAALNLSERPAGRLVQGPELDPLLTNTTFMSKLRGEATASAASQLATLRELLRTQIPRDADTVQDAAVAMLVDTPGILVLDDLLRQGESPQQVNRKLPALDRVVRQRLEEHRMYPARQTVLLSNLAPERLRRQLRQDHALAERLLSGRVIEVINAPYGSARGRGGPRRRS